MPANLRPMLTEQRARRRLLVIAVLLLLSVFSFAGGQKTISGTVTDSDDHPVAKATIIIENKETHRRRLRVQTDAEGQFLVKNLKGTDYSVTVVPEVSSKGITLRLDGIQPPSKTKTDRAGKRSHSSRTER